jgi:hypothetical protein
MLASQRFWVIWTPMDKGKTMPTSACLAALAGLRVHVREVYELGRHSAPSFLGLAQIVESDVPFDAR